MTVKDAAGTTHVIPGSRRGAPRRLTLKPVPDPGYARDMEQELTIGELAQKVDIRHSTIRYYERTGLLSPAGRTEGNYRYYGEEEVERLGFIRAAQASGLRLDDIKALLDFRDGSVNPCAAVKELIEARLFEVNQQMKALRHVQRVLKSFAATCEEASSGSEECPVIEELSLSASRSLERRK